LQQHPFSVSSSAEDPEIKLTAKALGDFTSAWKNLEPGCRAFLEGPYGSFTLKDKPCFLIMGGIGITPAISILETLKDKKDFRKCTLIYGNENWEKIPFREKLENLQSMINLKVIHVLEKPHASWEGEKGLISKELIGKYLPDEVNSYDYFICGPEVMMDVAELALRNKGIDWRNIYTERFEMV
jgi:3-phenylpropionate/trans-cinnamate dioxygenase ferredoxin reductase subunit